MSDPTVIDKALEHLQEQRKALIKDIEDCQRHLKEAGAELAKVEQALVGLEPLGRKTLLQKAKPALTTAGMLSIAVLGAIAAGQGGSTDLLPPAPDVIVAVLHEGGRMTDEEILQRMKALGWKSNSQEPLNLVRSYLSRLVASQQIVRVGPSTYQRALTALNDQPQSETAASQ